MATPQQPSFLRAGVFNDGIDPQHASDRDRPPENGKHYRHRRDKPQRHGYQPAARTSVVYGKSVSVRVDLGGRRPLTNKHHPPPTLPPPTLPPPLNTPTTTH